VTKHSAKKGSVIPFLVKVLREAKANVTKDITTAWLEAQGLQTGDATYVVIRKKVGACLTKLKAQGPDYKRHGRGI